VSTRTDALGHVDIRGIDHLVIGKTVTSFVKRGADASAIKAQVPHLAAKSDLLATKADLQEGIAQLRAGFHANGVAMGRNFVTAQISSISRVAPVPVPAATSLAACGPRADVFDRTSSNL